MGDALCFGRIVMLEKEHVVGVWQRVDLSKSRLRAKVKVGEPRAEMRQGIAKGRDCIAKLLKMVREGVEQQRISHARSRDDSNALRGTVKGHPGQWLEGFRAGLNRVWVGRAALCP